MRAFLLGCGLPLLVIGAAWGCATGSKDGASCHYEWDASKRSPEEAKRFGTGSAVQVCTRNGAETALLFSTPVTHGVAGVCYFWVRDMSAKVEKNRFPKRQLYMQLTHGNCPQQDDPGYIENTNVPDGVFAELLQRWKASSQRSGKGFAFAPLTAAERKAGDVDFASVLKTPEGQARFKLVAIDSGNLAPDVNPESRMRAGFVTLIVADNANPSESYNFEVDWVHGEFRIVNSLAIISGC